MERIVLLAVAAAWAAVLLPPLLRNRSDNRPGSSVSDFSRQLSSLQRSVPTRGMAPMRSMSRPLTNSPLARPAAGGRPGQYGSQHGSQHGSLHAQHRTLSVVPNMRDAAPTGSLQRRSHGEAGLRSHGEQHHRQAAVHRGSSHRGEVRRRRTNVLFMLTMAFLGSLFLAATTHSSVMMYALALTFLSLCAYCYRLVQLREIERRSPNQDRDSWFRAA